MIPEPTLHDALEGAYRAFSRYPRPAVLKASPARNAGAILRTLSAAPLRELTGKQIGPYAGWALTTVGNALDYKHFLPRILEQCIHDNAWVGTQPSVVAQHLAMADWRSWPTVEQTAITRVFHDAWSQASEEHPNSGAIASDWLCGIAALHEDISPLLDAWLCLGTTNAMLQIAAFVPEATLLASRPQSELGYWGIADARSRRHVWAWVTSAAVHAGLRAATQDAAEDDRWVLEYALQALELAEVSSQS